MRLLTLRLATRRALVYWDDVKSKEKGEAPKGDQRRFETSHPLAGIYSLSQCKKVVTVASDKTGCLFNLEQVDKLVELQAKRLCEQHRLF